LLDTNPDNIALPPNPSMRHRAIYNVRTLAVSITLMPVPLPESTAAMGNTERLLRTALRILPGSR
jgi:hypothetical protein